MTRLAVKTYAAGVLANVTAPMPCDVWVQLPKEDEVGTNCALIISIRNSAEKRLTIGGLHMGAKEVRHSLEVHAWWTNDNSQVGGRQFDILIATVSNLLRSQNTPTKIVDPETGDESNLILLGEEIGTTVVPPNLIEESDSDMVFSGIITTTVVEQLEG